MSIETQRIIFAVIVIAHGIGHALGVLPAFGVTLTPSHTAKSWLLSGIFEKSVSKILIFLVFTAATVGFVAAGIGMFGFLVPQSMWQWLASLSSIISIIGLLVFPKAFPTFFPNVIGALGVDIFLLLSTYWLHWPPGIVTG